MILVSTIVSSPFNGANTITNGPALGSDTTKFLRNDGSWAVPPGTSSGGNKIFIVEPTPPYSVGDLWIVDDNNISVCGTARASGSFDDDDWGSAVDTHAVILMDSTGCFIRNECFTHVQPEPNT